jgi:hypothetical protein
MAYTKKMMISTTPELDAELEKIIEIINTNRITGELSKSKIIRIAVAEWITRQKNAIEILNKQEVQNGISV